MNIWLLVGIGLVLWVLYDLYNGVTWIHRPVYRAYEPSTYWIVTLIWVAIAVSTLLAGLGML